MVGKVWSEQLIAHVPPTSLLISRSCIQWSMIVGKHCPVPASADVAACMAAASK